MLTSITGKSVVVTGASKGIGKGIAGVFARHGGKVLIVSRHLNEAESCAAELRANGGAASACAGDVTNKADMEAMVRLAVERNGGIDILCANAGIFPQVKLEEMTEQTWDLVLETNVKGAFLSVQAAIPELKRSGEGRIILTSSITGPITGFPGWAHYGASKAAQLGFVRTACMELAK
jgi:3-oxoacyl-[acyl-carrier protein] reductase